MCEQKKEDNEEGPANVEERLNTEFSFPCNSFIQHNTTQHNNTHFLLLVSCIAVSPELSSSSSGGLSKFNGQHQIKLSLVLLLQEFVAQCIFEKEVRVSESGSERGSESESESDLSNTSPIT